MKYVIVTGGVLSGLGKGITTSSIGRLLVSRGLKVAAVKIDPYVNVDAGTMNPIEHGEVFVLEDGGEVDQDLGNYERFLGITLGRDNNITTGKVFKTVIDRERRGDYLGKTVQIIPHVTNAVKEQIVRVGRDADPTAAEDADGPSRGARSGADVVLVEVGGTVGDIESAPFLEALRQLQLDEGRPNVAFVHTTLVPVMGAVGEQKTKPTQHSVMELRRVGIEPDMLVCRSEKPLEEKTRLKLAAATNVAVEAVVSAYDAQSIYEVPVLFDAQNVADTLIDRLGLHTTSRNLRDWRRFVERVITPSKETTIAVVGKYIDLADSYVSIREAFTHAGAEADARVDVKWVDSEEVDAADDPGALIGNVDAILVPGGFGSRGAEGKIKAIRHARENRIPFLGICFGFQLAVVEYARHVTGLDGASSSELDPETAHAVIDLLPGHTADEAKGASMRLGASDVHLAPESRARELYGKAVIRERHRHRWEVNPGYVDKLEEGGLRFSGRDPTGELMEVMEVPDHPFFVGSQFHPEFKSRPVKPAPLFRGLVNAALERRESRSA